MEVLLEEGFVKVDNINIPIVSSEMLFSYMSKLIKGGARNVTRNDSNKEFTIDFVQMRKEDAITIKAIIYNENQITECTPTVYAILCEKHNKIKSAQCKGCGDKGLTCEHIIEFLFWLHRNSNDDKNSAYKEFWDVNAIEEEKLPTNEDAIFLKNVFPTVQDDYIKLEDDIVMITPEDGDNFLQLVLDEMEKLGLTDSPLYNHCRVVFDELEPLYIHHAMIDALNNNIIDFNSFKDYSDKISVSGLFQRVAELSPSNYKKRSWMEIQYCRIRCSLMHAVFTRQEPHEDEDLLNTIFCVGREKRFEEKKIAKEHKRFILKQTEKLENKEYRECGLILNETYPFICASPDGITDDHIVEIKVPKTEEEFEKYLVGKETIAPKYMAQMQVQMYLANVQKALYCVLSPKFEINGAMHYVWVQAELQQIADLLSAAEDYWRHIVFPKIMKVYVDDGIEEQKED